MGGIFILPIIETAIASYADSSGNMGLYFGVSKLADGLDRPLGSLLGGWLLYSFLPPMTWFIFAGFTMLMLIYVFIYFGDKWSK
jgi:hypothetical protein